MSKNNEIKSLGPIVGNIKNLHIFLGDKNTSNKSVINITEQGKLEWKTIDFSPVISKSMMEIIDNSIDIFSKNSWLKGDAVEIKISDKAFFCKDNGPGIPIKGGDLTKEPTIDAFTTLNSGSNYGDGTKVKNNWKTITKVDDEPKGKHGVGSSIVFAISKKAKVVNTNADGGSIELVMNVNASQLLTDSLAGKIDPKLITEIPNTATYNQLAKTAHGVTTVFFPDWELYRGVDKFTADMIAYMRTYMLVQMGTFPKLKVKFNGKTLKAPNLRKLVDNSTVYSFKGEMDLIIHTNPDITSVQFTNGLINSPDNAFTKAIQTTFVKTIRDYLSDNTSDEVAAFAKPKLITDTFPMILSIKKYPNLEYIDQFKVLIGQSLPEVRSYYKDYLGFDIKSVTLEFVQTKAFKDWVQTIVDSFDVANKKKIMSKLKKAMTGTLDLPNTFKAGRKPVRLYITEGQSPMKALAPIVDVQTDSLLALTGKIDNIVKASAKTGDLTKLIDMREDSKTAGQFKNHNIARLMNILGVNIDNVGDSRAQRFKYDEIIIAADADDDGAHIVLLVIVLICFIDPSYKRNGKLKVLYTPEYVKRNKKEEPIDVIFDPEFFLKTHDKSELGQYDFIKGLGTLTQHDPKRPNVMDDWNYLKNEFTLAGLSVPVNITDEKYTEFMVAYLDENNPIRKDLIKDVYDIKHL